LIPRCSTIFTGAYVWLFSTAIAKVSAKKCLPSGLEWLAVAPEGFMAQSSRSRRTPFCFSEVVRRRLDMYALAAGTAAAGALALVQPAHAKVVYTPAHHEMGEDAWYPIALNHARADFLLANFQSLGNGSASSARFLIEAVEPRTNGVAGGLFWASVLKEGALISKGLPFGASEIMASECSGVCGYSGTNGRWVNVTDHYLGLKFKIEGKYHYGWARLNVKLVKGQFKIIPTLTGYAYETIPYKPIIAGDTGSADATRHARDDAPGSLGSLARGTR
jgi:hypothetical protein